MIQIKKWLKNLRYKFAYLIAPDWIDDLEERFSAFLCYQTGGRLSKCYYNLNVMLGEANDYQQRVCDECEYKRACCESEEGDDGNV